MKRKNNFRFIANELSLDFANTLGFILGASPREKISSYADLARWSEEAGLTSAEATARLLDRAAREPAAADSVLERARRLRASVYSIFAALAGETPPPQKDLDRLNEELARAMGKAEIFLEDGEMRWGWRQIELDTVLSHVARAAARLLVTGEPKRIRRCSDDVCGWLFYDTSKNRNRRWCDMRDCGNLAKARRFRQKV